jgi:hypothetical protein
LGTGDIVSIQIEISKSLDQKLVKLQEEACVVQQKIIKARQAEYNSLAAIYMWWRAAKTVDGYLEEAYKATLERRAKSHLTYGQNFSRLLYLIYGTYGIDESALDRRNRVLNKLHEECEKNTKLYAKDGVQKLGGFIKSSGGLGKLIAPTYQIKPSAQPRMINRGAVVQQTAKNIAPLKNVDPIPQQSKIARQVTTYKAKPIHVSISDAARVSCLHNEAVEFLEQLPSTRNVTITPPVPTRKDGYGLVLVKRTASGYEIIDDATDNSAIKLAQVNSYRKQFAALPISMRCLLETIKTQTLPANIQKDIERLTDSGTQKNDAGLPIKARRRLMYRQGNAEFVLSPSSCANGVVTIAKPKVSILEGQCGDVFMPTRTRKLLEQRLICTHDFNLFKANSLSVVPTYSKPNLASHLLRLDNKSNHADFLFVEFWAFEEAMGDAVQQLVYKPEHLERSEIKVSLPSSYFKRLATDHIDKWLSSYGDNITRPSNQLFEFSVNEVAIQLGFDFTDGQFRNLDACAFDASLAKNTSYKACFLSKDICAALSSLNAFELIGEVVLCASSAVMALSFETDAASYTIAVPTADHQFKRCEEAFEIYSAGVKLLQVEQSLSDDESFEDDLILEAAFSTVTLPDSEIENLVANEFDDYEELLEGWLPQAYEELYDEDAVEWVTDVGAMEL